MANHDASIRVHTEIDNSEIKKTQKEIDVLTDKLERLRERAAKVEVLGGTEKQFESIGYDCEKLENKLAAAYAKLEELENVRDISDGFEQANVSAKKLYKTVESGQKKANSDLRNMSKMMVRMMAQMLLSLLLYCQ